MTQTKSNITAEEIVVLEKELYQKGYRQIGESEDMEQRHFKITAQEGGEETCYTITWCD